MSNLGGQIKELIEEAKRDSQRSAEVVQKVADRTSKKSTKDLTSKNAIIEQKREPPVGEELEDVQKPEPLVGEEPEDVQKPEPPVGEEPEDVQKKKKVLTSLKKNVDEENSEADIIERLNAYDNGDGTNFLHIRVNKRLYNLSSQLSSATKISLTTIVGCALTDFFKKNPELNKIIKNHFKNLDL
ncbi:hypothetical protein EON73_01255 [bacterium]|nr:MAG: hypothetical protein EON73_01255 [bacterium]